MCAACEDGVCLAACYCRSWVGLLPMFSPWSRSKHACRKVSWATYTTVRYFVAYAIYSGRGRRAAALSLGITSSLSFLFAVALALSFVLPSRVTRHRPRLRLLDRVLLFLVSFFLFAPTVVNLVLVLVWRHAGSNSLSLRGRCHWNLDVVWVGIGGQCADHAPAFGVWLTAAILRLVLTVCVLVRRHLLAGLFHKFDLFSGFAGHLSLRVINLSHVTVATELSSRGCPQNGLCRSIPCPFPAIPRLISACP